MLTQFTRHQRRSSRFDAVADHPAIAVPILPLGASLQDRLLPLDRGDESSRRCIARYSREINLHHRWLCRHIVACGRLNISPPRPPPRDNGLPIPHSIVPAIVGDDLLGALTFIQMPNAYYAYRVSLRPNRHMTTEEARPGGHRAFQRPTHAFRRCICVHRGGGWREVG